MRSVATLAVLIVLTGTTAAAQTPGTGTTPRDSMMRRFQPPPDHWMTMDSLSQTLNLTADQKTKINGPYTALNGVMKDAAARRAALRQQMQGSYTPGQPPTPEQRAKFDSVRAEMEGFQAEADQWVTAIRNALTPEQQAKFDALPKPQLTRRGGPGGGQPRP